MSKPFSKDRIAFYERTQKEYDETIIKYEQLQEAINEGGIETYDPIQLDDLNIELRKLADHIDFLAKLLNTRNNNQN